jgi:SPASM domain peptide maturase of grasp-with-spasm system
MSKYLHIFQPIFFSKGRVRGIIIDPLRQEYLLVPKALIDFSKRVNFKTIEDIYCLFPESEEIVDEYLKFLLDKELAEWQDKDIINNFKFKIDTNLFDLYPPNTLHSVIDISNTSNHNYKKIQSVYERCNVLFLQFRIFNNITYETYASIDEFLGSGLFLDVEVVVFNEIAREIIEAMVNSPYISKIITSKEYNLNSTKLLDRSNTIKDQRSCGMISPLQFNTSPFFLHESKSFNTCLNKKLSIDREGNIKNCPSMAKSYGNINDPNLDVEFIVNSEEFQKVWHINKDKIHVCKDCEFRHVCTDCRAYVEDPKDILSKPLKCGYNPYTTEWEEWSTHPMKQKAIDYYGMRDIINS